MRPVPLRSQDAKKPGGKRVYIPPGAFHIQLFSLAIAATAWDKIRVLRLIRIRQSKASSSKARLVDLPRNVSSLIEEYVALNCYESATRMSSLGERRRDLRKAPISVDYRCCEKAFRRSAEYANARTRFKTSCLKDPEVWDPEAAFFLYPEDIYEAFEDSEECSKAYSVFMERHIMGRMCMLASGDMAFWIKASPTSTSALDERDCFAYNDTLIQLRLSIDRFMTELQLGALKKYSPPIPASFFIHRIGDLPRVKPPNEAASAKSPSMKPTKGMPKFLSTILRLSVIDPPSYEDTLEPTLRDSVRLGEVLMPISLMKPNQPWYSRANLRKPSGPSGRSNIASNLSRTSA